MQLLQYIYNLLFLILMAQYSSELHPLSFWHLVTVI